MKTILKTNFFVILLITIIMDYFFDNKLIFLFILELSYLILLAVEKIILPLHSIKKTGIKKNKYYRDELSNYSPFINACLMNREIFDADVIVAMFLYLEDKGYDGSETYENITLLPHEMDFIKKQNFYLSYLKEKDYTNKDLIRFKKLIVNDMIKENILIEENRNLYIEKIDLISFLFVMVHLFLFFRLLPNVFESNYIIMELFYNITWFSIYICSHILNLSIIKLLTPKGKKYYGELLASRNFLKDFSIISSRNIEEKKLWDSYLYNAILFNLKGKLDNDAQAYYKILLSKNNYYVNKTNNFYEVNLTFLILLLPWFLLYFKGSFGFEFILKYFINGYLITHLIFQDIINGCLIIHFSSKTAISRFFGD